MRILVPLSKSWPPKKDTAGESAAKRMLSARGQQPLVIREPQQKGGQWCTRCRQYHRIGSACPEAVKAVGMPAMQGAAPQNFPPVQGLKKPNKPGPRVTAAYGRGAESHAPDRSPRPVMGAPVYVRPTSAGGVTVPRGGGGSVPKIIVGGAPVAPKAPSAAGAAPSAPTPSAGGRTTQQMKQGTAALKQKVKQVQSKPIPKVKQAAPARTGLKFLAGFGIGAGLGAAAGHAGGGVGTAVPTALRVAQGVHVPGTGG